MLPMKKLPSPEELFKDVPPRDWHFIFDFDGTLADFHADVEKVVLSQQISESLIQINRCSRHPIMILSGRDYNQLTSYFDEKEFYLIGEHGARSNFFELDIQRGGAEPSKIVDYFLDLVEKYPGSKIERKPSSTVFHFRNCKVNVSDDLQKTWFSKVSELTRGTNYQGYLLNKALEIKDYRCTKLQVVKELSRNNNARSKIICFGDDVTEEEIFQRFSSPNFISVAVGQVILQANYKVDSPTHLGLWLQQLSKLIKN